MTIYVDDLRVRGNHAGNWAHLMSDDSVSELHEFAIKIGLSRDWFQAESKIPHYDLTSSRRRLAIERGALQANKAIIKRLFTFWHGWKKGSK